MNLREALQSLTSRMRILAVYLVLLTAALLAACPPAHGDAMLDWFNTSWNEMAARMPEIAEAGYDSLWIPPATKATGGLSVGYDEFDAFDLGSKDQAGSVSTLYGTQADLLNMIAVAHRFGLRVYLDNVVNHRGFQVPGYDASTPINLYPGLLPEDFHLLTTPDGFYRNTYNIADWNNAWDVVYESLEGLIDLANEPGATNLNFGPSVGSTFPKIKFVRHPNNPEYYCYTPNGTYVGFGASNGITVQMLQQNPNFYGEYVQDFENRAARWEIDTTKADGMRLDAVKSVRDDFFGAEYGADKDTNSYGYCGQIQLQHNLTHAFSPSSLRASNFDTEAPRANAIIFGEHLGAPPAQQPYIDAGMRLLDNNLSSAMNGSFSYGPLNGFDSPGGNGLPGGPNISVAYVQSADYGYANKQALQYAFVLARQGLPVVYTDGFHYAGILGSSGKAFPANSYNNFLGQFSDPKLPSMLYVHNQFARGNQVAKWSDGSVVAFERQDKRENSNMNDADGTVLLFMMNANGSQGQQRGITTTFAPGSYLWQYARGVTDAGDNMAGFYYTVPNNQQVGDIIIPRDGYFAFSWRTPEPSNLWNNPGGQQIAILQNGTAPATLTYPRKDGPNGDPDFNPYGVQGATAGSYSYPWAVPRITDGSQLSFIARADGSAENVLIKLDGGVDVNSQMGLGALSGEKRDNPPTVATDVFLGYEQMQFVDRQYPEKFGAIDTTECGIGSQGEETYITTVGSGQFSENAGPAGANSNYDTQGGTVASFLFHDPKGTVDNDPDHTTPAQYIESPAAITIWAKTNAVGSGFRMYAYYTSDGSFPEGAGGAGIGTTQAAALFYHHNAADGGNWWTGTISPKPGGKLTYKLGVFRDQDGANPAASVFPSGPSQVAQKVDMMTTFQITGFNGNTALVHPHNDYAAPQTGLSQGFHVLRTRQFLKRQGRSSIYNTTTQTFYYDTQLPQGDVAYPNNQDTIGSQQYGVVVRTDQSVTEVDYQIVDSDPNNDDSKSGIANGNNAWVKAASFTANPTIQSQYPNEWRFNYVNVPSNGTATISVRLKKLSSSSNNALSDAAGHFTTVTRTVNTSAPPVQLFIEYPSADGATVGPGYVMKVWFSNTLAAGLSQQALLSRFLITVASSESGNPENPVALSSSTYTIDNTSVGPNGQFEELAVPLPNLYNGQPGFQHTITATYSSPGKPTLSATRLATALPVVTIADNILTPPEVDANGNAYLTILPDVANPTPAQRSTTIIVQTDAAAQSVAIQFTSGPAVSPSDVVLTGSTSNGNSKNWSFMWGNVQVGAYKFTATVTEAAGTASAMRDVTVVYRQLVTPVAGKLDNDDDGLPDDIELTRVPLPGGDPNTWTNDQVHRWVISGKTNPLSPDTDGDGLPDGLEAGLSAPMADPGKSADTNTTTSTNGSTPNFQPDLDPPLFNTTDNTSAPPGQDYSYYAAWPFAQGNPRTDVIAGTMTDPTKPDTDDDGLKDGIEDLTFAPVLDATGNPILDGNGHQTYRPVHNGRVDILPDVTGLQTAIAHPPTIYNTSRINRAAVLAKSPNAIWLETDPNSSDTTGNGLVDGAKDANQNGFVDLAVIDRNQTDGHGNFKTLATLNNPFTPVSVQGTAAGSQPIILYYLDFCCRFKEPTDGKTYISTCLNKTQLNAVFRPNGAIRPDGLDIVWLETDPRRFSTSGDGLPDGWKVRYGLDPFEDGIIGHFNLHTGQIITSNVNGPSGSPAGDGITNLQKYANGDDPHVYGAPQPPPPGSITIGPVPGQAVTVGAVTNDKAFAGWIASDLIALDYYDGAGVNSNGGDVYHAYDGYDSSRDMVAFYARDGGDPAKGGDGNFYFRIDFEDLQAYAEQGHLDMYVAINFGQPGRGEYNLPDQVDTGTTMGWQAVVACYQGNKGTVYLWNPASQSHSTAIGQDLSQFGVQTRTQSTANGFGKAYFDSSLDAVEFSISRQALKDAGWDGLDPTKLIYQVFTTKDGTQNNPPGPGDIGGRSDIRDSIRNDWISSDYGPDQAAISGAGSVLRSWVGLRADNDCGKRIKIISILHGNEAIQPGNYIQNLINTNAGAGLFRPLDAHQAFGAPLAMHITPTLASAIQWASVPANSPHPYRDGPALNGRIASMIGSGQIDLLGSTFSDHILPYLSKQYNQDNNALASQYLKAIYGMAPSSAVFWTPERVSDAGVSSDVDGVGVLEKVADMGYGYTFIDQTRHIEKWFGRNSELSNDGYRVNRINGMNCFVINDGISGSLFQNNGDGGVPILLRQLLNRKARDPQQDQVVVFVNNWEAFTTKANADAYDQNIRWLANHPWIELVTPDQIANGAVDLSQPPDGKGDAFGYVDRGSGQVLPNTASEWIDHATEESYDNWYYGSGIEESLSSKLFDIRTGVHMVTPFGTIANAGTTAGAAWNSVLGLSGSNDLLASLSRGVAHSATFETAFHNQDNNDLNQFSTGAFADPDTQYEALSTISTFSQSQLRNAAIYKRVDAWANAARSGAYNFSASTEATDVDLDGEPEYLIFNDRVFAIFERLGGRMTNAWVRDINTGEVYQALGNPLSFSGSQTEEEGTLNLDSAIGTLAYRTSGLKDWFAQTGAPGVGINYVNHYFNVAAAPSGAGWAFTSSDGAIVKTVTLPSRASAFNVQYALGDAVSQIYIRSGMSPNLSDLLLNGQGNLSTVDDQPHSEISVLNSNPKSLVRSFIKYGGASGLNASYNRTAVDHGSASGFDTVPMRSQAQTQQLEIFGVTGMAFQIGFQTGSTVSIDTDGDGIPDWWTQKYFGHPTGQASDLSRSGDDPANDGLANLQKYILDLSPLVAAPGPPQIKITRNGIGQPAVQFATIPDRVYRIYYTPSLAGPWVQAGPAITGAGATVTWTDDGSQTAPPPSSASQRYYRVSIALQ